MLKKTIIKVIISVVLISITIITFIMLKGNTKAKYSGSFTFIVDDINQTEIINDELKYKKGDTLLEVLDDLYHLDYETSGYGVVLYGINDLKTNFTSSYLALYVYNDLDIFDKSLKSSYYSTKGLSFLELNDKMVLYIVEEKI